MAPIRVLHVVVSMDAGGIETMLMNYYRNIDRTKLQFDFMLHCKHTSHYESEILELGGKIYKVPSYHPKEFFKYKNALKVFFDSHKEYKVVHSHIGFYSMYALKAAKNAGVPVRIAHSHCANKFWRLDATLPFRIVTRRGLKKQYTHLYACSPEAAEYMVPGKPCKILNNAIDVERFIYSQNTRDRIRAQLDLDGSLVIGHVGRFTAEKNHSFILDVFAEISKKNDKAKLLLIGSGKLFEEMKAKAQALGIFEKVIFTGVRRDIADLMCAMDVFIFPSKFEGFPVTLIEAQSSDLPCVVSDTFSKTAILSDKVKVLSLNEDVNIWADALLSANASSLRRNNYDLITEKGLNIKTNAKELQNTYLEAYKQ